MLQRRTMRRTRFHTVRWSAVLFLALPLGLITALVLIMVKAWGQDSAAGAVLFAMFAIATLAGVALVGWMVGLMLPVTVTRSALRIPSAFRTVVIPLSDVAGVGLLYHTRCPSEPGPSAWLVFVWRGNGSAQRVAGLSCRRHADAPPNQIGRSRAGRMARRLDSKVRAMQGPAGNLATLQMQKHARVGLTDDLVAFWSPDGDMGPMRY